MEEGKKNRLERSWEDRHFFAQNWFALTCFVVVLTIKYRERSILFDCLKKESLNSTDYKIQLCLTCLDLSRQEKMFKVLY